MRRIVLFWGAILPWFVFKPGKILGNCGRTNRTFAKFSRERRIMRCESLREYLSIKNVTLNCSQLQNSARSRLFKTLSENRSGNLRTDHERTWVSLKSIEEYSLFQNVLVRETQASISRNVTLFKPHLANFHICSFQSLWLQISAYIFLW